MVRNLCNVASSRERSNKRIVVGIYRLEGTCYTDKVSLAQVEIATVAQDPTYRMLTQGDAVLRDGTFASNAFVDDYYSTVTLTSRASPQIGTPTGLFLQRTATSRSITLM